MKEHYDNLNGLRAYAAIGIVMMHILANGNYAVTGFVFDKLIPSFTNFTFLFMMVSAFSMCCGYYKKFKNKAIDLEYFYKRRYEKIWPFFAALCTLALIMSPSAKSLYEFLADLTLAFGLIPNNNIEIIGVGWFLGIVFVFYMMFPFFTFLIENKKRAWFSFLVCLILNLLTVLHFSDSASRTVFIYSAMFFMAGGLVYLYRKKFLNCNAAAMVSAAIALISIILFYSGVLRVGDYAHLIILSCILIFSLSAGKNIVFSNKFVNYISSISLEIYLSHMVIYRLLEKLKLTKIAGGGGQASYFITVGLVLIGAVIFSEALKKMIVFVGEKIQMKSGKETIK